MNSKILLLLFVIVVLLYLIISGFQNSSEFALILSVAGILYCVLSKHSENFADGPDFDDVSNSEYYNVSVNDDIDHMDQRILGMQLTNDTIDNSDVVEQVVSNGTSLFQPNWKGVSPTSNAEMSNFNLAQPHEDGEFSEYDIPLTGSQNIDELLARKQQHRGSMNKKAIDGSVRTTRNMFEKYFINELAENEEKEWWTSEAAEIETDFLPY